MTSLGNTTRPGRLARQHSADESSRSPGARLRSYRLTATIAVTLALGGCITLGPDYDEKTAT